jgi:hypothetical protein
VPGPLVADWISWSVNDVRAGALTVASVEVENAGTATWREDVAASYHWLDPLGNPIVWDGLRSPLPGPVAPGGRVTLDVAVRAPIPPGRYRFALDLVAEHRAWFAELGAAGPQEEVDVRPRVDGSSLHEVADLHVPGGWELAPGAAELALAVHAEGYAAVAGSVEAPRRLRKALAPWSSSAGRDPAFAHPLLCPSVLKGIELERVGEVEGLPAFAPPADEPWLYDGRVVLRPAR